MAPSLARAEERLLRDDFAGAEEDVRAVLEQDPDDAVAHHLLGLVHAGRGEHPQALTAFTHAIRLRTPYPDALVSLALCCNRSGAHELALDAAHRALAAVPGHALARVQEGHAWRALGRPDEARAAFELAGPHPLARLQLGHQLLLANDLEHGLPLLEERRALTCVGAGLRGQPWNGEPRPDARLLVIPETGLGDFLFASRFLPALADRFAHVTVLAPAPLARLVATLDPRLEIVTALPRARWDLWAPALSLPWLLGVRDLGDLPPAPWIRVPGAERARDRLRAGIQWAGDPSHPHDARRSTSLESFAPLLEVEGLEWVSLHVGAREFEAEARGLAQPLRGAADFLDTARVIAGLDLVVATDSAVANLAAAMGVPTCVMTTADADWRWGGWYPGVTCCAQQEPGNWFGAIAAAAGALLALLDGAGAPECDRAA